jgi:hypothetical protein
MSNPDRHDDPSLDEIERLLLRSGHDCAPDGAKQRALVAASTVVAASTIATGQAVASIGIKAASIVSGKWAVVLCLTSVVAASGAVALHQLRQNRDTHSTSIPESPLAGMAGDSSKPPIPQASATPYPEAVSAPMLSAVPTLSASTHGDPVASALPSRSSSPANPSFSAELSALDRARTAIANGEAGKALAMLDDYSSRFPRGSMGPEASVLRIEALAAMGNHSAAERVARAFLEKNPASPYAQRIKSLLAANP